MEALGQSVRSPVPVVPVGWFPDPDEVYAERYFDGEVWTLLVRDGDVQRLDTRRGGPVLEAEVRRYVRAGYLVASSSPTQAVVVRGKPTSHLLHLVLTLLTFGLWGLFVWLPLGLFGGVRRRVLTLDVLGRVVVED